MAKVKLTAQVSHLSGSIAGTTYTNGRFGLVAQTKSRGASPPSPLRSATQAVCSLLVQGWRDMTEAQRRSWLQLNLNGLSGFALFRWWNFKLARAYMRFVTEPVFAPVPDFAISFFDVIMLLNGQLLTTINMPNATSGFDFYVEVSRPQPLGRRLNLASWYFLYSLNATRSFSTFNRTYLQQIAHFNLIEFGPFRGRIHYLNRTTGQSGLIYQKDFTVR